MAGPSARPSARPVPGCVTGSVPGSVTGPVPAATCPVMGARVTRHGPVLVVALMLAAGLLASAAGPAAGVSTGAEIDIFDDDGGRALFPGLTMAPGHTYAQCITVGTTSAVAGHDVRFGALDVLGDLPHNLRLVVETGQGGRFGDCTGFSGSTIYDGTLAALGTAGLGAGVATGWQPAAPASRSFRVTASLDSARQGQHARGRLVWWAVGAATPARTTTTAPAPATTADSTDVRTDGSTDDPTDDLTEDRRGEPGDDPVTGSAGAPSGPPDDGSGSAPDLVIGSEPGRLALLIDRLARTAIAVLTSPGYPLLAIATALAFLVVQDRIDRRDPKLAAAGRRRDNEAVFPDRFTPREALR